MNRELKRQFLVHRSAFTSPSSPLLPLHRSPAASPSLGPAAARLWPIRATWPARAAHRAPGPMLDNGQGGIWRFADLRSLPLSAPPSPFPLPPFAAKLLDQPLASAGDLQAANRPLDICRGTAVVPLGPGGLEVVAAQHRQQLTERPIVEIQLHQRGQCPKRRRAVECLPRFEHHGNAQPAEDLAHQPADLLRRAEHQRDLSRPRLAIDQQPFDPRGDQFDFADLPGRRENLDAQNRGIGDRGLGIGEVLNWRSSLRSALSPSPVPRPSLAWIDKQHLLQVRHCRPLGRRRTRNLLHRQLRMPATKLGQRPERLGKQIGSPRFSFQRQRDDRSFCAACEKLDDLVLRPREVGETVDDDEMQMMKDE